MKLVDEENKSATDNRDSADTDALVGSINGNHSDWRIALYYCYIELDQKDEQVDFHKRVCEEHELKGRIRVSEEGINGVVSGLFGACQSYERRLRAELCRLVPDEDSWELDVKYCQLRGDLPVHAQLFDSLICKATSSVVSLFEPSHASSNSNSRKKGFSKQTNRRRRRQQQRREQQQQKLLEEACGDLSSLQELANMVPSFPGGQHLSPQEWNDKLCQASEDAILMDCRNVYESNVGYFQAPNSTTNTLLTNTRKYSDLPKVLAQSKDQWSTKRQIFMYCTGGVRCEQASKFVQALVSKEQQDGGDNDGEPKEEVEVYQLHGGIQRYLEHFHTSPSSSWLPVLVDGDEAQEVGEQSIQDDTLAQDNNKGPCLYRGLNFVFDPRRTDPMTDSGGSCSSSMENPSRVGKCCLCGTSHDDYDNGHAPVEEQEARCFKCRILLLVCTHCREKVQCWGENHKEGFGLPKLYCGIDTCSDYQATGKNPVSMIPAQRAENTIADKGPTVPSYSTTLH